MAAGKIALNKIAFILDRITGGGHCGLGVSLVLLAGWWLQGAEVLWANAGSGLEVRELQCSCVEMLYELLRRHPSCACCRARSIMLVHMQTAAYAVCTSCRRHLQSPAYRLGLEVTACAPTLRPVLAGHAICIVLQFYQHRLHITPPPVATRLTQRLPAHRHHLRL